MWGPPVQSNKGLAVLCFVYSGQIIQTTVIPAVFPAVNHFLQAEVERGHCGRKSPVRKTEAERKVGCALMCCLCLSSNLNHSSIDCSS